ncbi:unnamed protein product [Euphydryas editha]|uniref:Helitron helicase-like domain-containing protein n=1 Tax=Euphydryas editha TaxID=104508 RepID=A0AAU9V6Y0_EUPED|nr:unnamed protein product [Euphydryas editha]
MIINPLNGKDTTKKISSIHHYAYRLMIRQNADKYLLRFHRLFQQYCVDMYVKIETKSTTKLRSEEFIHFLDGISTEGDAANARLTILPVTYTGSSRHMHLYDHEYDRHKLD